MESTSWTLQLAKHTPWSSHQRAVCTRLVSALVDAAVLLVVVVDNQI